MKRESGSSCSRSRCKSTWTTLCLNDVRVGPFVNVTSRASHKSVKDTNFSFTLSLRYISTFIWSGKELLLYLFKHHARMRMVGENKFSPPAPLFDLRQCPRVSLSLTSSFFRLGWLIRGFHQLLWRPCRIVSLQVMICRFVFLSPNGHFDLKSSNSSFLFWPTADRWWPQSHRPNRKANFQIANFHWPSNCKQ